MARLSTGIYMATQLRGINICTAEHTALHAWYMSDVTPESAARKVLVAYNRRYHTYHTLFSRA